MRQPYGWRRLAIAICLVVMEGAMGSARAAPGARTVVAELGYRNGAFTLTVDKGKGSPSHRIVIGRKDSLQLQVQPVNLLLYKVQVNAQATTEHWPAANPYPSAGADTQTTKSQPSTTAPPSAGRTPFDVFESALVKAGIAAVQCNALAADLSACIADVEAEERGAEGALDDLHKRVDGDGSDTRSAVQAAEQRIKDALGEQEPVALKGQDISAVGKSLLDAVEAAYDAVPTPKDTNAQKDYDRFVRQRDSLQASFDKAGRLYNAIRTASFSGPAQTCSRADGNRITFTVTITPNTELIGHQFQGSTCKINVVIRGGVEIDSSTGFAISRLVDHKYRVNGADVERVKSAEDTLVPAAAALLHVYRDTDASVKWGGSVGVATDNAKRVDFLLGGSLFFTNDRRFVLTLGTIVGPVKSVDRTNPIVDGAPNLVDRISWAPFLAVTYNLSR
jgi:hypothetical protein